MGRPANSDVDLVVERVPAQVAANWLRQRWQRREPVVAFERYGTAQLTFQLGAGRRLTVEVVRARSEAYSRESRKPTVRAGTMAEDAIRRDFTINTLLLDATGMVIDPTGRGLDDIRSRRLRTPLDPLVTFDEDPLRMFRAARFASQLDFAIDPEVEAAMAAASARIQIVSQERIRDELVKLLLGQSPAVGLRVLLSTGLLAETIPELARLSGVEQGGYHPDDVFDHTAMAVELAPVDKLVRLAALFHDIGKPETAQPSPQGFTFLRHQQVGAEITRELMRRLRFSGAEIDQVARLVELHMRPIQYRHEWADSAVRRLWHDAGALAPQLLELARADTRASTYPGTGELDELERRMAAVQQENPQGIRPPLGGNQLKAHFQLPDGPWIGRAQRLLTEAMVEGKLGPNGGSQEADAWRLLEEERPSWQPRAGEPGRSQADGPAAPR
jgi:poly(A) polymerase